MPRFFFATNDGEASDRDDDGIKLANEKAAADEAQSALADIAKDRLPNGSHANFSVEVKSADGMDVYRATLKFDGQTGDEIRAIESDRAKIESDKAKEADEAAAFVAAALRSKSQP